MFRDKNEDDKFTLRLEFRKLENFKHLGYLRVAVSCFHGENFHHVILFHFYTFSLYPVFFPYRNSYKKAFASLMQNFSLIASCVAVSLFP